MRKVLIAVALLACAGVTAAQERPAEWATPVEKIGLPNLHRVGPALYRGAQPTAEGMRELEKLGVKTVINLREHHDDRDLLAGTRLDLVQIPFSTGSPRFEDVLAVLAVVADPRRQPVFVHCQHGADRTGMVMALYRVAALGWTKERAIVEMRDGGYGFHSIWRNLIRFILAADVDALKKIVGTVPAPH